MITARQRRTIVLAILSSLCLAVALVIIHDAADPSNALTTYLSQSWWKPLRTSAGAQLAFVSTADHPVETTDGGDPFIASTQAPETVIDQTQRAEVLIRNDGKQPLEITLAGMSCDCLTRVELNGGVMPVRHHLPATLAPGESGQLAFEWINTAKEVQQVKLPKDGRFSISFYSNDPTKPRIRLEVNSRLVWSREQAALDQPR
jgi:hypothetical protein